MLTLNVEVGRGTPQRTIVWHFLHVDKTSMSNLRGWLIGN